MASNTGWLIQENPCCSRQKNPFSMLSQCIQCYNVAASGGRRSASAKGNCRFKGFRLAQFTPDKSAIIGFRGEIGVTLGQGHKADVQHSDRSLESSHLKGPGPRHALPTQSLSADSPLHFPHVYNRPLDASVVTFIKGACALSLLPILRQELCHMTREGIVFLKHEIKYRSLCDACASELFCGAWFCPSCGLDLCHSCAEELTFCHDLDCNLAQFVPCSTGNHNHSSKTLRPCTRLTHGACVSVVERMSLAVERTITPFLRTQPLPLPLSQRVPEDATAEHKFAPRTLPVYRSGDLSRNQFLHLWTTGIPVIITEAQKHFQGHWDPPHFIAHYGKLMVTPIDCESGQETSRMSASNFFALLLKSSGQWPILKLKDWPPKTDFKATFGRLDYAFFRSVPIECADLVCQGGIYNLTSHFPEGAVAPDLGPKLYIAMGARGDTDGTTKLHLDVTCAINLMMWSEDTTCQRPGAEWQIFPADSVESLRCFLREELSLSSDEDPIHRQEYYISHVMLARLREKHGVSPWTIYQYYGDIVLIPAGCPHQVRNLTHAIKAACDFVSPQNLSRTANLASSLRAHRIASGSGEDLLQLQTLLWFGWMSMSTYEESHAKPDIGTSDNPNQTGTAAHPIVPSTQPEPFDAMSVAFDFPSAGSSAPVNRKRGLGLTANQLKRARKKAKTLVNPEFQITCPFPDTCSLGSRARSVLGTIDHLRDSHPETYQKIDPQSLKELRGMDDVQFVTRLQDLLNLHQ